MNEAAIVPPVLYLPMGELSDGTHAAIVRELTDGRRGLLAYTALDRLSTNCGENQPWALVETADLSRIHESQPFDVVVFDQAVPANLIKNGRII